MPILRPNLTIMKRIFISVIICLAVSVAVDAQVYTNKPVGEKSVALVDSLKTSPYPYALPIWGKKVTQLGFDLPYSAGLGVNFMTQESELVISNLMVGFNNGP